MSNIVVTGEGPRPMRNKRETAIHLSVWSIVQEKLLVGEGRRYLGLIVEQDGDVVRTLYAWYVLEGFDA